MELKQHISLQYVSFTKSKVHKHTKTLKRTVTENINKVTSGSSTNHIKI